MKRLIALFLLLSTLLSGCALSKNGKDKLTFYYVRNDYQQDMSSPIGSEQREAPLQRSDLSYILALYLMGPSQENLASPFPRSVRVQSLKQENGSLEVTLTDTGSLLSEADYSLACACLSLTILDLTEAERVSVISANRSITITRDNLSYQDTGRTVETEEPT